ncbi:MAG: hypothetical protein KME59_11610 [Trichormus sp. ATA11-4-KO1]|jgi:hypothetical protein|nr:hypothetical protein [Trichormus sp. ATA11-4-KO1]
MKISGILKLQKFAILSSGSLASIFVLSFSHLALAQQTCVRTDAGNIVCGALMPQGSDKTTPKQDASRIEANGFSFQLQNCLRSGTNVTCNLLITKIEDRSGDRDGLFLVNANNSRIINVSGEEFVARSIQLGEKQGASAQTNLVSGVPLKASISFEVPAQFSKLALLEVGYTFYNPGYNVRTAQFRNVTIESR